MTGIKHNPDSEAGAFQRVGKLASFGIEHPWQAALFLPSSFLDCRHLDASALDLHKREKRAIRLTIKSTPTFEGRGGPPRIGFTATDGQGASYRAAIFGDSRQWLERLQVGHAYVMLATGHEFNGTFRVTIHELLPDKYAGRLIPVYPVPKARIEPEAFRALIARFLPEGIPVAAQHIESQLDSIAPLQQLIELLNAPGWTIEQLLQQAHYPHDDTYIQPVRATLMRLSALGSLAKAAAEKAGAVSNPIRLATLDRRMLAMPFTLTEDQANAIRDIAKDMASPVKTTNRVVAGDVGVGKTAVIGVIAAATADAGRRSVVLFPSTLVARQAHAAMCAWSPDLKITLVTGETGGSEDLNAPILVGTSALLHRNLPEIDVLMCDEQHRWARDQRELHRAPTTHFVELSATCIPRTQALVRFGHLDVSEMRQTHKPKFIETTLHIGPEGTRKLMDELLYVVRGGNPVFIIYPKREKGKDAEDRLNIEAATKRWENMFPGRVATLTGDDDEATKEKTVAAIRGGLKQILLCTTVVEVGVDVPNLRHIVVIDPQNYGLVQLHQLRGRVARAGGEGWCYLLAPNGLPLRSRQRMDIFMQTTDGFRIAEADLEQRGAGDLSSKSSRQHGADGNFLHGTKIDLEIYDQVFPLLQELRAA